MTETSVGHASQWRHLGMVLVFLALLVAAFVQPQNAVAGGGGKPSVTFKITTSTQRALLRQKALKIRVKARGKTVLKLSATLSGNAKLVRSKTLRFKKRGARTVSLRLTPLGLKRLSKCGAKSFRVLAKQGRRVIKRAGRRLAKDPVLCVKPKRPTCDPLDPAICSQPFPSNLYTRKDSTTSTGIRLDYPHAAMPANKSGVKVDPAAINQGDGFSQGSLITVKVPQVDTPAAFDNTGFVSQDELRDYMRADQPVLVFDTTTHERWPIWAELDSNPTTLAPYQAEDGVGGIDLRPDNTGPVNLIVRPARNFAPGHTYVIALRNLKDADNQPVAPQPAFKTCRDRLRTTNPELTYRCNQLEERTFPELAENGISRKSLYLAWDFTVGSEESVTNRALQIRDDAFARLGDTDLANRSLDGSASPTVEVTNACGGGYSDCGSGIAGQKPPTPTADVYRYVDGFIRNVPCYLNQDGCPSGSHFEFNPDGTVKFNPAFKIDVPFRCLIPASAESSGDAVPGRVGIFGHGLLGTYASVAAQAKLANQTGSTWCATHWSGFSNEDLGPGLIPAMADLSNFYKLVDRMQQGFVNFMMLGRAAIHSQGFASQPEFQIGGESVIDTSDGDATRLMYMGISQGGIMGAALTALEPDVDHGVLNVTGTNYSTLLQRSVDFDVFASMTGVGLWTNYPDESVRQLGLGLMQLLWDRGEGNGYAPSLRAGQQLPNTPPHDVLMQLAVGDHQVPTIAAEVEARTIGAKLYSPTVNPGRHWELDPFMDIPLATPPIASGNTAVYYDGGPVSFTGDLGIGTPVAPSRNLPPRPEWGFGADPHPYPYLSTDGRNHAASFLYGNGIPACQSGGFCYSNGWTGP